MIEKPKKKVIEKKKKVIEESDEEEDEESDEDTILDLKGLSENTDFEKEKIMVDDTFSASQLRQLCKNMGLSVSGNEQN